MKKIFLLALLVAVINTLQAQEEKDNMETLFKSRPEKVRGYAGPMLNITYLDGETAYMSGFTAGGIFNDHVILGVYASDLQNSISSDNSNYIGYKMDFNNKGIMLGYIVMPKKIIHFNSNLQLGKGDVEVYDDVSDTWFEDDFLFLLTPSLEAEFNIAKFFRLGIGINYRFAFDVNEINNYDNNDFSGLGTFISFKFGWFR